MSERNKMNRRNFLSTAGKGAAVLVGSSLGVLKAYPEVDAFQPDIDIALRATQTEIPILPGNPTQVYKYRGSVIMGDSDVLQNVRGSYLGPIIRAKKGQKVRIRFKNDIPEETIIHWHGLHVPSDMDGHPRDVIRNGRRFVYEYEVKNRAGTYWYHPHPHGHTGPQVNRGLAGFFLVSDDEEEGIPLPQDEYDIPLVIQDRTFDLNNQFVYSHSHEMNPMEPGFGFLGNTILVNGKPDFRLSAATRVYRLRLLNGSNSRIYKLAWDDGKPLVIIGVDGGLLKKPVKRNYVMLAPGERIELWADFSAYPVGSQVSLRSLPFDTGMMGGWPYWNEYGAYNHMPLGSPHSVFRVQIVRSEKESLGLPETLTKIKKYNPVDAHNYFNPRTFRLSMRHMTWTINGRTFQMESVANDEVVKMNSLEVWEFINDGGFGHMGAGMSMPHPMHLHGPQFQVIERRGVVHNDYVDNGWKDTVLLMPGERVKVLVKFEDYDGLFLYHCHNLEHEDMGMMRNYFVQK
jgi:FtsP/CotA-like multicopper oxidase with cupredoxin domain